MLLCMSLRKLTAPLEHRGGRSVIRGQELSSAGSPVEAFLGRSGVEIDLVEPFGFYVGHWFSIWTLIPSLRLGMASAISGSWNDNGPPRKRAEAGNERVGPKENGPDRERP